MQQGGRLEVVGTEASNVYITRFESTGSYNFSVYNGGIIYARHTTFQYMAADGLLIGPGGIVEEPAFQDCSFRNGALGGKLLSVENEQDMVIYNTEFLNYTDCFYNVYKPNDVGSVNFYVYSGNFSGPTFDLNPFNRINWYPSSIPPVTDLAISYSYGEARLDWDYPLNGFVFNIFSSDNTYNNFVYITSTTSRLILFPLGLKKFYYVEAQTNP